MASRALKSVLKEHAQKLKALNGVFLPVGAGAAAQPQPALATSTPIAQPQPKPRGHNAATKLLYARVREIPRSVPLKEFCERQDRMQRPFPVPKRWRDDGCPAKLADAWLLPKWKRRIHDLRQHAWQNA